MRRPPRASTWALAGALCGLLAGGVVFAPASWLAGALAQASGERLLLADARGTVWTGNAVPVLTGGPDSRDAAALPGRVHWKLRPRLSGGPGVELRVQQACCMTQAVRLHLHPGWRRWTLRLQGSPQVLVQWPAAWLAGLGTPWNTLQLAGTVGIGSPGLRVESTQGQLRLDGRVDVDLQGISSRVSPLDTLGSYRLGILPEGTAAGVARLELSTREGRLQLQGSGRFDGSRLQFRGDARAAEGAEPMLNNLLNIIGRRQGALSIISIG